MQIWIRIYPAIEPDNPDGLSIAHSLTLELTPALYVSVYRSEEQARQAEREYGGIVLPTTEQFLKDYGNQEDHLYLKSSDESGYIDGDPALPTSINCVVVAASLRDGDDSFELSDEDNRWVDELEKIVKIPITG